MRLFPRYVFFVCALAAVACGFLAALALAGVLSGELLDALARWHAPIMVHGFLLVLIGLERALARRAWWGLAAPAACTVGAFGGLGTVFVPAWAQVLDERIVAAVWGVAFVGFAALTASIYRRREDVSILVEGVALATVAAGTALWASAPTEGRAGLWWACGLVGVIAAERLDLARLAMPKWLPSVVLAQVIGVLVALTMTLFVSATDFLVGTLLATLALTFLVNDVARRTRKSTGVARMSAYAMLCGWGWVAFAAAELLLFGYPMEGMIHDSIIHALTVGCLISMIMAHAPVIAPALLRRSIAVTPASWVGLVALETTLFVRIVGAGRDEEALWRGGVVGGIVAFIIYGVASALTSRKTNT
ncbi:MAG: hypothetical protein Q4B10_03025 [Actinomycetaceae bacterium]|nr:hypothetical protein [Actinomycetaceae bacterium]